MAAAASEFSGHSDLLVASAAKETEYMRNSAAASVAAFVLDGLTDLLLAPAANAFHYMECQNVKQTLQAAATAVAILVRSPFVAIVLHVFEWCWFAAGFWALTQAVSGVTRGFVDVADSECDSFKGKDGQDADGSLSLGKGKASGRVDVPVGVNASLNTEMIYRSGQSVAFVTPGSCVVKTIVDGHPVVHRVHEHTVVGDLLDCTEDVSTWGHHGSHWYWDT